MKKGFTLAEVLITLGILGVIAAITLPGLNRNIQQQQIGPKLSKAINTLQNATTTIMQENNWNSLPDPAYESEFTVFFNELSDIMNAHITANGRLNARLLGKDGIEFNFEKTRAGYNGKRNLLAKYSGDYIEVTIDLNGFKNQPNKGGEDTFIVNLDLKGIVIPAGGNEYVKYTSENNRVTCNKNTYPSLTDFKRQYCTGSIVDAGYKVEY